MPELRYQLDEHLPTALAEQLRQRGIDVLTAHEADLRGQPDTEYLARSLPAGRVTITSDVDFIRLHVAGRPHAGIVWFGHGTRTIGQIVESLELLHIALDAEEMAGRLHYL